jgi:hypothetical protein
VATEGDPEIILKLPLSALHIIMQHLNLGAYGTVVSVVNALVLQAVPQIELATAMSQPKTTSDEAPDTERLN